MNMPLDSRRLERPPQAPAGFAEPGPQALAWLQQRHSVGPRHLGLPAPGPEVLAQAAALACRAPDHHQLRPYRFVIVPAHRRDHLASLFAQVAQARGQDPAQVQSARDRAQNGPALLALVVRIEPEQCNSDLGTPEHEQWLCAGAALMNFLNALHLQGFAAKVLSGSGIRHALLQSAFCEPGEQLVAWIAAGTPSRQARARPASAEPQRPVLSVW